MSVLVNEADKAGQSGQEELRLVFSPEAIAGRIADMAAEIDKLYGDDPLLVVCVLKGGLFFFTDLVRNLHKKNVRLDFLRCASYGNASVSSGNVRLVKDVECDVHGWHVLLVDDIVDSGRSMEFLAGLFSSRGAKSLRFAALVDKNERREREVAIDFSGFLLDKGFLVGYGMDYAEAYRNLPGIYELVLPAISQQYSAAK